MSFPLGTEMFQFSRFASFFLCIQKKIPLMRWVFPFGYLWINAYWRLPTAFRSLSRPSSPLRA
jgi:hypothetical protein